MPDTYSIHQIIQGAITLFSLATTAVMFWLNMKNHQKKVIADDTNAALELAALKNNIANLVTQQGSILALINEIKQDLKVANQERQGTQDALIQVKHDLEKSVTRLDGEILRMNEVVKNLEARLNKGNL